MNWVPNVAVLLARLQVLLIIVWLVRRSRKRAKAATPSKSKSKSKSVWIVVRHSNNTVWAGPWRGDGRRWTVVESKYGLFASQEAAEKSVESEYPPFNFRWDVFEL